MVAVLADLHHFDLYYSLQLLFEKRLGWSLYRPIGMDWYHQKLWKVYDHPGTAAQYLSTEQAVVIPRDVHGFQLPEKARHNNNYTFKDGIYYVEDPSKGKVNRGVTLDAFKSMKFDILISSMPDHIPIFNKLIKEFQPQAKHIFQVGNAWGHQPGVRNILASTASFPVPPDINICFYHQEFDLNTYAVAPPDPSSRRIRSFIHYMREMELYNAFKEGLSEFEFCSYGGGMDKDLCKSSDIAQAIKESTFVWHIKPEGDGMGHAIHNAFAMGRPPIVKMSHYRTKLAGQLMKNGETCIDIEGKPLHENLARIRSIVSSQKYPEMCAAAAARFKKIVNYDAEFEKIKAFLARLR